MCCLALESDENRRSGAVRSRLIFASMVSEEWLSPMASAAMSLKALCTNGFQACATENQPVVPFHRSQLCGSPGEGMDFPRRNSSNSWVGLFGEDS